ncbi:putative ABC transporter ATP-binding protein YlmA [Limihaloglobus sulfuriphilus]|uniref:Putative ABC transporter ATP-binding protein YlmA n=1 Tax=Limihaloglobus sulfuriphilus TaxID=1851148 RepID=A0A1Q2MDG1_9BACT|nr:ATP-binding cassette domain-containing protein [Limihaloglobus sulfuriphilus]AQQ70302.1 putative ABC transporter ATP-binding protein YlmA [Limihaloglobus sulfuriphilus]
MQRNKSNILNVESACLNISGKSILRDINFELNEGQRCVVLGANGSGKSTFLSMIAGYTWPSQGNIWAFGHRFGTFALHELRKRIGLVATSRIPNFDESTKVGDIVATGFWGGLMIPMYAELSPEQKLLVEQELAEFGLEDFYERPFWQLSTGERSRVLIARAMISRPGLLLLDEPAAGLDIRNRTELLKHINSLINRDQSPAVILVTHHFDEIPPDTDRIVVLKDGEIYVEGEPGEILNSDTISQAYGCSLEVIKTAQRYVIVPSID